MSNIDVMIFLKYNLIFNSLKEYSKNIKLHLSH